MFASSAPTSLAGATCLVVGATDPKSIGYNCAAKLVELGAEVCIVGRDADKVESAARSLSAHASSGGCSADEASSSIIDACSGGCSAKEVSDVVGDLKQSDTLAPVFQQVMSTTSWDRIDGLIDEAKASFIDACSGSGSADEAPSSFIDACSGGGSAKEVSGVVGDLKQPDTMASVFQHVMSTTSWFRLDVLIVSVGNGKSEYLGLDPQKADDYRMSFDVAVLSPQFLIDAAVPYLAMSPQRGGGSVVVVGSMAPLVPWPDTAPYNYARAAQNCMVETLAFRHRTDGIRVNAVLPSCIHTGALDLMATKKGKTVEEYAKLRAEAQPTGRNGTPEEVADAVLFLASGTSSYLTGELMKVGGGLHLSSWFNRPKITKEFVGNTDEIDESASYDSIHNQD